MRCDKVYFDLCAHRLYTCRMQLHMLNCSGRALHPRLSVVIDAYPNTAMVDQGTTLVLVCRVVGVPSTTVLSYQWTCPGSSCDAGAVDTEWAARIQQGNILVVNVRNDNDNGAYTCTVVAVGEGTQPVGTGSYSLTVTCELCSIIKGRAHTYSLESGRNVWFPFIMFSMQQQRGV